MTTIPEELNEEIETMDSVNWDATVANTALDSMSAGSDGAVHVSSIAPAGGPDDPSIDLLFGDIDGDDWSYWALQHYDSTQLQRDPVAATTYPDVNPEGASQAASQFSWELPEAPCTNCSQWAYQCKKIREGKYRGYCTSCVALRRECSFGPSAKNFTSTSGAAFPANPWPIMGEGPETCVVREDEEAAAINSGSLAPLAGADGETPLSSRPQPLPKIGARFSRESVKVLKNWVVTHSHHPYPTDEERERLQKITGLNKTQITNWLANARRRGKIQPTRAISPHVGRVYAAAMDIPQRRGAPGLLENMNPLQRWENSPPENEPASVTAIARAVSASGTYSATSGSGRTSPNVWNLSDDGSGRSLCNQSSTSSLGTSQSSGGSFASVFSNQSRSSSIPSFVRSNRGRRRRRRAATQHTEKQLGQPPKTFQCTFCTESFRTKHDWQRHEKSLHLSLERWICSPEGGRAVDPETGLTSCAFCGEANPDDSHIEAHNLSSCSEHAQEERTFYRKDHLRQHLRLVHDVKFLPWSMDKWRVASPAIRSRCGFCEAVLDSWAIRVDHIAEHFKTGNTMADWKGDWGFDAPVLEMVENSIPPYLIDDERQSHLPFRAGQPPSWTPTNAYELLKIELQWWLSNRMEEVGASPSDSEIQMEACRIIYGAEVTLDGLDVSSTSWLCDLVMCSEEAKRRAAFRPRTHGSNCLASLRINGKADIFESCLFERELQDYVRAKVLLGLTAMDHELQDEACTILRRMEEGCSTKSDFLVDWFIRMIKSSSSWLRDFQQRAGLLRSEDVGDTHERPTDLNINDYTIHNSARLEAALEKYLEQQRLLGIEPTDSDLQRQARIIVFEVDDMWNQTATDDKNWLERFKRRHSSEASRPGLAPGASPSSGRGASVAVQPSPTISSGMTKAPGKPPARYGARFLSEPNCYRRLAEDLGRFVAATISPNNPNRHIPTDEELQHQARCIVYDDDDPFNRTAANNAEWLQRFKVDVGLLPPGSGPGLGTWLGFLSARGDGDSGSESPCSLQNSGNGTPQINLLNEGEPSESTISIANQLPQASSERCPEPARIFCNRELEKGLTEYVKREIHRSGLFPSDRELQQRARDILNVQRTPCDDSFLLGRFKAALQGSIPPQQLIRNVAGFDMGGFAAMPSPSDPMITGVSADLGSSIPVQDRLPPALGPDIWSADLDFDLDLTDQDLLDDILQDVNFGIDDSVCANEPKP
ncbi:hypothetical protein GGR50DRAFT_101113 [Xylaria sp. CBS 124048]|nr:hypothetical protein GGR50DRAFT_101113 [Xylaria sp. CBS 124048]